MAEVPEGHLLTEREAPDSLKVRAVADRKTLNRKRRKAKRKKRSKDKMTVSEKIRLLRREGYKQKQAVAIALSMLRRGELREG